MTGEAYYIVQRAWGWAVCASNIGRGMSFEVRYKSKDEAILQAKSLAIVAMPCVVRLLAPDGSIEMEWIEGAEPHQAYVAET